MSDNPFPLRKQFHHMHRHGFVRVATSTPRVRTADVAFNMQAILSEAKRADECDIDLVLYPEMCLSSYVLDDLVLQSALLDVVEGAVEEIVRQSADLSPVLLIGAPLRQAGRVYNCALAIAHGRLLGAVPKSYLPNYREFYEKRWFAHGRNIQGRTIRVGEHEVPFGTDLLFAAENLPGFVLGVEICEDFWAPDPPSTRAALAGATIQTAPDPTTNTAAPAASVGERPALGAECAAPRRPKKARPRQTTRKLRPGDVKSVFALVHQVRSLGTTPSGV